MHRRDLLKLILASSSISLGVDRAAAKEGWSMFGRNLANTSYTDSQGPEESKHIEWKHGTGSKVLASPSVVEETVYVGSWDGKMYALDTKSGRENWVFECESALPDSVYAGRIGSSASVVDEKVIFGSWDGHVYALERSTGDLIWSFDADSIVRSSPSVKQDRVYIGDWTGSMNALNLEDGSKVWSYDTGNDHVYSTPCVKDDTLYFGGMDSNERGEASDGGLYAVEASSGEEVWKFQPDNGVGSSPSLVGGVVYFGSFDGNVYALDSSTGEELWRYRTGGSIASSPAVDEERVYIGSWDNSLYALDLKTGDREWGYQTDDRLYATNVSATDGAVYFGSHDGKMRAVRPEDGELLWRLDVDNYVRSGASVVNGELYFGAWDGYVYCLTEEGKKDTQEDTRSREENSNHTNSWNYNVSSGSTEAGSLGPEDSLLDTVSGLIEHLLDLLR